MCLYPKLLKNRKYTQTKKNGGHLPTINDERTLYVPIGCQLCIECRKKKAREWQVRLQEEIKNTQNGIGIFVTLTLSDQSYTQLDKEIPQIKITERENWKGEKIVKEKKIIGYTRDNAIATLAVRRFLERYRKEHKISIRHWLITELGHEGTENIHIHGILWNKEPTTWETIENIKQIWNYGYIYPRYPRELEKNFVNNQTINYITKYVYKTDEIHTNYTSIVLTSAGIGNKYTNRLDAQKNKYNQEKTIETYKTQSGHKIALPIYYRNKIYTEQEREQLWIQQLNKQQRYVLGQKIDISKGEKQYYEALKKAQQKNIRLGYNNPYTAWRKSEYEEQRRILMQETRRKRASANTS